MNLQEMFEAAKAKWPKQSHIHVSQNVDLEPGNPCRVWYYLRLGNVCDDSRTGASGRTPEECLANVVAVDRVAKARKMIEDANKILDEEGVLPEFREKKLLPAC